MNPKHAQIFRRVTARIIATRRDFGGLDPFEIQDLLAAEGVLNPVPIAKPCGPDCRCAEEVAPEDFPVECYQLTEAGRAAEGAHETPPRLVTLRQVNGTRDGKPEPEKWLAIEQRGDDPESWPTGWGATPQEALDDLMKPPRSLRAASRRFEMMVHDGVPEDQR